MERLEEKKDYYVGLDCGTNSVGWAVTDTDYKVLGFNGKAMWGVRLFEEAKTAKDRRVARCARRRTQRKRERIDILQGLLAEEVLKADPDFFARLDESRYRTVDKVSHRKDSIFSDASFRDKDYLRRYPTVFHLRHALVHDNDEAFSDIRLVYLGIHNIIKNRGHFLFTASDDMSAVQNAGELVNQLENKVRDIGYEISCNAEEIGKAVNEIGRRSDRKLALRNAISMDNEKIRNQIVDAINGYTVKFNELFDIDKDDIGEDFPKGIPMDKFEDHQDMLEAYFDEDQFELLTILKAIYDYVTLSRTMGGYTYISDAKIALYEKNRRDTALLKHLVRTYAPAEYDAFFRGGAKDSFASYTGYYFDGVEPDKRCSKDDFHKAVKKLLNSMQGIEPCSADEAAKDGILASIDNGDFLVLLRSSANSVLPYQLHMIELKHILENARKRFAFLSVPDETGLTISDKIISLMKFRIPYYVGPLNPASRYSWIVRKESGKILPWNFEEKVDINASAEAFITNMTSTCTYLKDKKTLPKCSLLYQRYLVLNELNNLKVIQGGMERPLSVEDKQTIYEELFMQSRKVSASNIRNWLLSHGYVDVKTQEFSLAGIDKTFRSSLGSYHDFKPYLEQNLLDIDEAELIIRWITLFSDDQKLLRKKISDAFGSRLDERIINRLCNLKYKDWGALSKEFLCDIYTMNKATGEAKSIISMLWETNDNLMQLLSRRYDFAEEADKHNRNQNTATELTYDSVKDLRVSPSVRREIWQTILVVKEIVKIMGYPPKKVFMEFAREKTPDDRKARTTARKDKLMSLYKSLDKKDAHAQQLLSELKDMQDDSRLRSKKLYLYYTQMGRSMYSGKIIDIDELDRYDIDHIIPQSVLKDDSFSNTVLVEKELNGQKSDNYPIPEGVLSSDILPFWNMLEQKGFITKEKLSRLTRRSGLSDEELAGFIERQIVETRQSTKIAAELFREYFGDKTKVVYSKAGNVSDFRQQFDILKCRAVNDLHHAKDAYLNIVVGNVFDVKFNGNPLRYILDRKGSSAYGHGESNIQNIFLYSLKGAWSVSEYRKGGETIKTGEPSTIAFVKNTLLRNDILFTRQAVERNGALFNLMPLKGRDNKNGALITLKPSDPRLKKLIADAEDPETAIREWNTAYGGYDSASVSYFCLVKHKEKNKCVISFQPVRTMYKPQIKTKDDLLDYCRNKLKLTEPEIIKEKVLMNTLIICDGFPLHITGVAGAHLTSKPAIQLVLSKKEEDYIRLLSRFQETDKKYKGQLRFEDYYPEEREEKGKGQARITKAENIELYSRLMALADSDAYRNRPSSQAKTLASGFDEFIKLDEKSQIYVLSQMLNYFSCQGLVANLEKVKGSRFAGVCNLTVKVPAKHVVLVSQSVTGLFENREEITL